MLKGRQAPKGQQAIPVHPARNLVGLMMWMWLSIIVVLVGAELNSEIEHQTAHDSTVGLAKPLGVRGAVMADTVGAGVP